MKKRMMFSFITGIVLSYISLSPVAENGHFIIQPVPILFITTMNFSVLMIVTTIPVSNNYVSGTGWIELSLR